jgi:acyl carrier protein
MRAVETNALVNEIVAVLQKIAYVDGRSISAETRLGDLGLDSLDLVEAGLELEAIVGNELPDHAFNDARTIRELAACFDSGPDGNVLSLTA